MSNFPLLLHFCFAFTSILSWFLFWLLTNILEVFLQLLFLCNFLWLWTFVLLLSLFLDRVHNTHIRFPSFKPVHADNVVHLITLLGYEIKLQILQAFFHIFFLLLSTWIRFAWFPRPIDDCVIFIGHDLFVQFVQKCTEWWSDFLIFVLRVLT